MVEKFIRLTGLSHMAAAVLLLASWVSIGVWFREEFANRDFVGAVVAPAWVPVNVVLLAATFLILVGVIGLYLRQAETTGRWGLAGLLLALVGVSWYLCIQYYETFLWPVVAADDVDLFGAVGFSPTNELLHWGFMGSGLTWGAGFIILSIKTIRSGLFPKWAAVVFAIGAVAFGLGIAIPIRTLGAVLFAVGMFRLGYAIWRDKPFYRPVKGERNDG